MPALNLFTHPAAILSNKPATANTTRFVQSSYEEFRDPE